LAARQRVAADGAIGSPIRPCPTVAARSERVHDFFSGRQLGVVRRCRMPAMKVVHSGHARGKFFKVLQTSKTSQTAMMTLKPGQSSGPKGNDHPTCEQVLLVLEGEVVAEVRNERRTLEAGDVVVVPKRARHRFTNKGKRVAVTFNVYAPPAYAADEESDGPDDE
jgi:mannose-6-phosphate isomerase-like protein (cupin superfamily)